MLRKLMIACAAIGAIAVVSIPTDASARGGHRGGGWHHGGGWRGGFGPRFGYYPYAYGAYGCYRTVRVFTPFGPRWRRVWVCG